MIDWYGWLVLSDWMEKRKTTWILVKVYFKVWAKDKQKNCKAFPLKGLDVRM